MGLINYKNIDFNKSINKELKTFDFNGSEIAVVPYLSITDKYDFVMITLQKSFEKNIYNQVKLDMYFDLHLVYMYTNVIVDSVDREDEFGLYDTFMRSGLIAKIKEQIPNDELNQLKDYIEKIGKQNLKYENSFIGLARAFVEMLPENIEKIKDFAKELGVEGINSLIKEKEDASKN